MFWCVGVLLGLIVYGGVDVNVRVLARRLLRGLGGWAGLRACRVDPVFSMCG